MPRAPATSVGLTRPSGCRPAPSALIGAWVAAFVVARLTGAVVGHRGAGARCRRCGLARRSPDGGGCAASSSATSRPHSTDRRRDRHRRRDLGRRRLHRRARSRSPIVGPRSPAGWPPTVGSPSAGVFDQPRRRRPRRVSARVGGPRRAWCGGSAASVRRHRAGRRRAASRRAWRTGRDLRRARTAAETTGRPDRTTATSTASGRGATATANDRCTGRRRCAAATSWCTTVTAAPTHALDRPLDGDAVDRTTRQAGRRWALDEGRRRGCERAAAVGAEAPIEITDADAAARWTRRVQPGSVGDGRLRRLPRPTGGRTPARADARWATAAATFAALTLLVGALGSSSLTIALLAGRHAPPAPP